MAQLGSLPMMKQAVSLLAGYGMSIWMVWQDLSQLKALYEHCLLYTSFPRWKRLFQILNLFKSRQRKP